MKSPLLPIVILSNYKNRSGDLLPLPTRMVRCTPDNHKAIWKISDELSAVGESYLNNVYKQNEEEKQNEKQNQNEENQST